MQRRRSNGINDGRPRKEIVGYVCVKVRERFPPSCINDDNNKEETLLRYLNPKDKKVSSSSVGIGIGIRIRCRNRSNHVRGTGT